jgi:hypothetical protein
LPLLLLLLVLLPHPQLLQWYQQLALLAELLKLNQQQAQHLQQLLLLDLLLCPGLLYPAAPCPADWHLARQQQEQPL